MGLISKFTSFLKTNLNKLKSSRVFPFRSRLVLLLKSDCYYPSQGALALKIAKYKNRFLFPFISQRLLSKRRSPSILNR